MALHRAEIAQFQRMLPHHSRGSGPKLAGTAGDHSKASVKQHRSSEQVISLPDSYAGLIFFPLKLSFLLLLHYFLKQCMGDQTEQRRWDSHFVVAGKSSETGAPDAPQRGRKLKLKFLFSVDVVLNKTQGLRGSAGMFRVFEVSTSGKSSSSLIQNTCQVLIFSLFWGKSNTKHLQSILPCWHLGISCCQGTTNSSACQAPGTQVPWQ